ncbi:MAG: T9SS type A sorting domain-containing protein [Bacteroidetes bacterium]|nr:T9SS type A sorting domain-containing protein [Bacteroidota bacterium]
MKKLLLLSILMITALYSWASIQIDVSGHVTDASGNGVANVTVHIASDSTANNPIGYYNTVLTDATGFYSDSFEVPESQTQGSVLAYIECINTINSGTDFWHPGNNDLTIDLDYCDFNTFCEVYVDMEQIPGTTSYELTAEAFGEAPFSYLWSTGETTQTIVVTDEGTYCVDIADANGCTSSSCVTVVVPGDCSVEVSNNPASGLSASATGQAPFTYFWSTGETTANIQPNAPGLYCVTITDNTGCEATSCEYYGQPNDTCSVELQLVQNDTWIQATASGVAPFTYSWSTGETGAAIQLPASGDVCVTITDASGCVASSCYSIMSPLYQIAGTVHLADSSNFQLTEGVVYLIVYDPVEETLEAIDMVDFESNPNGNLSYDFGDVPAGQYLVKAALNPGSLGYAENLPSYHMNELFWDEADEIEVPYLNPTYFDIVLTQGVNPGGPGFIGGNVNDGANFGGSQDRDPVSGISVLLLDANGNGVIHTETDEEGIFKFPDLAWGTYQVIVEIPGLEQGHKWVTIGPDNPSVSNVEFEVGETAVTTAVKTVLEEAGIMLSPNPVLDALQLQVNLDEQADIQLEVFNATGQLMQTRALTLPSGEMQLELDFTTYADGLYLIRLTDGASMRSFKVMKQ